MSLKCLPLYRFATYAAAPLVWACLAYRKAKGKEDLDRFPERLGIPSHPRPEGRLIWMHGASVGETLSMLPLINRITETYPDMHILVTSGTVTSAHLMAKRLPERAFHQYIPVDGMPYAARFVDYWKPDVVLWLESEFWPNILSVVREREIPLFLINGRVSDKSFRRWKKMPKFSAEIQELFTESFGQTDMDADRLAVLGARKTACFGNLKFAAPELPYNADELKKVTDALGRRPCWIAASTHADEETDAAFVHEELRKTLPDIFTVIAPRHPNRGDEIEKMLQSRGLKVARRSRGDEITAQTDVYLADTIGEMGLFYRMAPVAFVGGSLIPFGGQNMIEPARLKRAVLCGPHTGNFKEIVARSTAAGALTVVRNKEELADEVKRLLSDTALLDKKQKNAAAFAATESGVLDRLMQALEPYFNRKEQVTECP